MNKVPSSDNALAGQIAQTGSKIKVHWSKEEIGDTRWRSEWYVATVHKYCEKTDMLTMLLRTCKNQIKPVMKLFMYIFYTFPTLPMYFLAYYH